MCGPLECIFCELCLPLTDTPSGGRNSEMRRRRGLARVSSCSPETCASFELMCGPPKRISCELCLQLPGTPSRRRTTEMRRSRGLARLSFCSPYPCTCFERMCVPPKCIFASNAFHYPVHLVEVVTCECVVG